MSYTTKFQGKFILDKPLTVEHFNALKDFSRVRHKEEEGCPSYYCQWVPSKDGKTIVWDGNEGFREYEKWLEYVVEKFLLPWGYTLNGHMMWQGEEIGDIGLIQVRENEVSSGQGRITYDFKQGGVGGQ